MKVKNWIWGLFFIAAAIVILASQFGFFEGIGVFTLTCTILLIPVLIKSLFSRNFVGVFFVLAILTVIYKEPLGIGNISNVAIFITAILGSIGFSLILGKPIHPCCDVNGVHEYHGDATVIDNPDGEEIDLNVKFGSVVKYIKTENLKQVNISSSFGAASVYFDNAKIPVGTAVVKCNVSFSGVELYIPKTWNTVNNINSALGGVEEKKGKALGEGPTLVLEGNVRLGGIEIIYV